MSQNGKQPWMMFYTGDWLKDPSVRRLSLAARGLWIDILCYMHECDRSGIITGTLDEIGRLVGCQSVDLWVLIEELHNTNTADVTKCKDSVTLINRRMKRDYISRNASRLRVAEHRKKKKCNSDVTTIYESEIENINEFEMFWKLWPGRYDPETGVRHKVGKVKAKTHFNKLSLLNKEIVFYILRSGAIKRGGTRYLQDAFRWLRDEGWQDKWQPEQTDFIKNEPAEKIRKLYEQRPALRRVIEAIRPEIKDVK